MDESFKQGFYYFTKNSDIALGNIEGTVYVDSVQYAIDKTIEKMKKTVVQRRNSSDATVRGFIAEDWHAGTFNADVAVKLGNARKFFASVRKDNDEVADIEIHNSGTIIKVQSKYYKTSTDTAKELSNPKYTGANKVAPADQVHGSGTNSSNEKSIADVANKQATRNKEIRPEASAAYADTAKNAKAVIEEAGYSSKELTNEEVLQIVRDMKNGTFDPRKYGLVPKNFIHLEDILNKSLDAGVKAATMSLILKIGPQVASLLIEMLSQGFVDKDDFKKVGFSALSTSAESFMRGAVSAGITATCQAGLLGKPLMSVDPSIVSVLTTITLNAMQNSIDMAAGRITPMEYADSCARDVVISSISFISGRLVSATFKNAFGTATQAIIPIPVIGFMVGSFAGSVLGSIVYEGSQKMILSVLVNTGFTMFGIVNQDYTLPKEVLERIGFDIVDLDVSPLDTMVLKTSELATQNMKTSPLKQCDVVILKRGMIEVRTVGYC